MLHLTFNVFLMNSRSAGLIQLECCFSPSGMLHHLIRIQQVFIDLEGVHKNVNCEKTLPPWFVFRFKSLHMEEYVNSYTPSPVISQ